MKRDGLLSAHITGFPARMHPSEIERLVGVDVPDSSNPLLVK